MRRHRTTEEWLAVAAKLYDDPEYGSPWQVEFVARCRVTMRTYQRWARGDHHLPGPVKAMIEAHEKCARHGVKF
jgi:hypothetical protein